MKLDENTRKRFLCVLALGLLGISFLQIIVKQSFMHIIRIFECVHPSGTDRDLFLGIDLATFM